MSRVFDIPRFKDQILHKLLLHLQWAQQQQSTDQETHDSIAKALLSFEPDRIQGKDLDAVKHYLCILRLIEYDEADIVAGTDADALDDYDQYCLDAAIKNQGEDGSESIAAFGSIISKILCLAPKTYADSSATIRFTHRYISGYAVAKLLDKDKIMYSEASTIAKDLCTAAFTSSRLGANFTSKLSTAYSGTVKSYHESRHLSQAMHAWNRGMEMLRMKGTTREVGAAHRKCKDGDMNVPISEFEITDTNGIKTLGCKRAFRVLGMIFLVYDSETYVVDVPGMDQIHGVAKSWSGAYAYAENYRVIGNFGKEPEDFFTPLTQATKWVADTLSGSNFSEAVPRFMKQSVAWMQNELHLSSEKLDVGAKYKSNSLEIDIQAIFPHLPTWHSFLGTLQLSDRAKLDLANLYYMLPAPDCDVKALWSRATTLMKDANHADMNVFSDFMKYVKTIDLATALVAHGKKVKYNEVPGYDLASTDWYRRCISGKMWLPPDEDFGKAWIEGFYPFNNSLPHWFWDAADVTHVDSDMAEYASLYTVNDIPRCNHNELLYAIKHAPMLSEKWDPSNIYDHLADGTDSWDRIAMMASKCENTKPGPKCRETWSANDITRELLTNYDRAAIPLASSMKGVTTRKSDNHVNDTFNTLCVATRPDSEARIVALSTDAQTWSPHAPRSVWAVHHDYVVNTTTAPKSLRLERILGDIQAIITKRGILAKVPLTTGLFQGWTGTLDSILNVHFSLYCVRVAKREGYLTKNEGAITAGLIDDAVQAIELDKSLGPERQQLAADKHFAKTCEVWGACGAKIDPIKTMYSSNKFIYLNRMFCEGSELMLPMKVFARADKEYNRRYCTVYSQIDTVFGAYRSSTEKGSDPLVSYYFAVTRALELIFQTNSTVSRNCTFKIINSAFAPRGLGGWGFPGFSSFLSGECPDSLTSYTTIMTSLLDVINDSQFRQGLASTFISTLSQSKERVGIYGILSNPRAVRAQGVVDPVGEITNIIRTKMINKCESQVFKTALSGSRDQPHKDALADIIRSCEWDATILELLGQCLPENCSAALADRAYKNELVTMLFPFSVRRDLSTKIRRQGAISVVQLFDIRTTSVITIPTREDAFRLASECREEFYKANDITVFNHTLPDYMGSLARMPLGFEIGVSIKCLPPVAPCREEGANYVNLYDGMPRDRSLSVPRSKSAYTFTGERFRNMSPAQKCISKAAIISNYLQENGGNGNLFWSITIACWGSDHNIPKPSVSTAVKTGVSTKRLSASTSKSSHSIVCFRNTQSCVQVDATALGKFMNSHRIHADYMAFVTAARTLGLCLMSTEQAPSITHSVALELNFGFLQGSLVPSDPTKLTVVEHDMVSDALARLSSTRDEDLYQTLITSFIDMKHVYDEDNEYTQITYVRDFTGTDESAPMVIARPGLLTAMLSSATPSPLIPKIKSMGKITIGDEVMTIRSDGADQRLRRMREHFGMTQSLLCIMMEEVVRQTPGGLNMDVASAPWRTVAAVFSRVFPGFEATWLNVSGLAKRYTRSLDPGICKMLLGNQSNDVIQALAALQFVGGDTAAIIVSTLYLAGYGRQRSSESYTITSAMGVAHMKRSWKTSALQRRHGSDPTRNTQDRLFMACIYEALGGANVSTKTTALAAIPLGIAQWSEKHCKRMLKELPREVPDIITIEGLDGEAAGYWIDDMLSYISYDTGLTNMVKNHIMDTIVDISVLGDIRNIPDDIPDFEYKAPDKPLIDILMPSVEQWTLGTEDMSIDDEKQQVSEVTKNAAVAMSELGFDAALRVFTGQDDYIRDRDPDDWMVEDWNAEYNSFVEESAAGGRGDEA